MPSSTFHNPDLTQYFYKLTKTLFLLVLTFQNFSPQFRLKINIYTRSSPKHLLSHRAEDIQESMARRFDLNRNRGGKQTWPPNTALTQLTFCIQNSSFHPFELNFSAMPPTSDNPSPQSVAVTDTPWWRTLSSRKENRKSRWLSPTTPWRRPFRSRRQRRSGVTPMMTEETSSQHPTTCGAFLEESQSFFPTRQVDQAGQT